MVRDLLKNYETYKTEIAICRSFRNELNPELERIEKQLETLYKCIDLLETEEADIIKLIFFKHKSIKEVADRYGYSKSGMQYIRDRTVEKLSRLFDKATDYL